MANPKINYQKKLDTLLEKLPSAPPPRLLLHSCCAPCSSYVLEYLSRYFSITVLYYNPNIFPREEYELRKAEQLRLISEGPWENPVTFWDCDWEAEAFSSMARGMEDLPEGGLRCHRCYELRLRKAASLAAEHGYDYFTTTLSISPLKDSQILNQIGEALGKAYRVAHLPSDFKKREGYKRSIILSKEYNLYRQDYCGCIFSKRDRASRPSETN